MGVLETLILERDLAASLLHETFPDKSEEWCKGSAAPLMDDRYRRGRWLSVDELRTLGQWPPPMHWGGLRWLLP